jgi:hypothetical protein
VSGCKSYAQGVGAVWHDTIKVKPYLPRCWYNVVARLSAKQMNDVMSFVDRW